MLDKGWLEIFFLHPLSLLLLNAIIYLLPLLKKKVTAHIDNS